MLKHQSVKKYLGCNFCTYRGHKVETKPEKHNNLAAVDQNMNSSLQYKIKCTWKCFRITRAATRAATLDNGPVVDLPLRHGCMSIWALFKALCRLKRGHWHHATLRSAAASITRFVCDFDVDVSGRVPQDRRLGWSVWMWPLSTTSWSRCRETTATLC